MRNIIQPLLLLLFCYQPTTAFGHGIVHEQIDDLTKRLKNEPNNTELLMKRGRLYIEDENYFAARNDFKQTLKLDHHTRAAYYYLGDIALKKMRYNEAVRYSKKFIATLKGEAGGLTRGYRLLGAAYNGQQEYTKAAAAYQKAIDASEEPRPSFFHDLADVYKKQNNYTKALDALNQGITRLGPLTVFHEKALEIEIQSGSFDAAIERLDHMIAKGQRLPILYEEKGRVLEKAGRPVQAKQAYNQALAELDGLPDGRQNSRAMLTLREKVTAEIKR